MKPTRTAEMDLPAYEAGKIVADRYRIESVAGVGGMGVVFRARDLELEIAVALKVLRGDLQAGSVERFRNEVLLTRKVSHPSVVRLHDLGTHEGTYFLTMDYVDGPSLEERLDEGPLPWRQAVEMVQQIALGLAAAHDEGIIHRDLKPANILLDGGGRPRITDFGIARAAGGTQLTKTGSVVGTLDYLAPEQARGETLDGRCDLYALGLILYEMLTGALPNADASQAEVLAQRVTGSMPDLTRLPADAPRGLHRVLAKALQSDRRRRFADGAQFAEALRRLLEGERVPSPVSRKAVAVGAVAVLATGAALWLASTRPWAAGPGAADGRAAALAILALEDQTGRPDLAWTGTGLAELLREAVSESPAVKVADGAAVDAILRNLKLEPGRIRQRELEQLADYLDVGFLVRGTVRTVDDELSVALSISRPGAEGVATTALPAVTGSLSEPSALVARLSEVLASNLDVQRPSPSPMTDDPESLAAYVEGVRLSRAGELLSAQTHFEKSTLLDPSFSAAWLRLARVRADLGYLERAQEAVDRAVSGSAGAASLVSWESRALQAELRGDPEETERILRRLIARYPNIPRWDLRLAEVLAQRGRLAEAVEVLREVVARDPDHPRAWYELAKNSILMGDSRKAVDEYLVRALVLQNRLDNAQGRADVLNAFGVAHLELGELETAADYYQQAAGIRDQLGDRRGYATTLRNLALVDTYLGRFGEAEGLLQESLDILTEIGDESGVADLRNEIGILEEDRGRYRQALDQFRRALETRRRLGDERGIAESLNNVAYAYYLLDEYDNAEVYWSQALETYSQQENPVGAAQAQQGLGELQLVRGRLGEANRSFLDALERARDAQLASAEAAALGGLGRVARLQGRFDAALQSLGEALEVVRSIQDQRGVVEMSLDRIEVLLDLGRAEAATQAWSEVEPLVNELSNAYQQSELLRLGAVLRSQTGDGAASERSLQRARSMITEPTSRSHALRLDLTAHSLLPPAERGTESVLDLVARSDQLGHVPLRLLAAEIASQTLVASGSADRAARIARNALRLEVPQYGRTYALHRVLHDAARALDDLGGAARHRSEALKELERILEGLAPDTRRDLSLVEPARSLLQEVGGKPVGRAAA